MSAWRREGVDRAKQKLEICEGHGSFADGEEKNANELSTNIDPEPCDSLCALDMNWSNIHFQSFFSFSLFKKAIHFGLVRCGFLSAFAVGESCAYWLAIVIHSAGTFGTSRVWHSLSAESRGFRLVLVPLNIRADI